MMHFYVVELLLLFIIPPVGMDAKFRLEGKEISHFLHVNQCRFNILFERPLKTYLDIIFSWRNGIPFHIHRKYEVFRLLSLFFRSHCRHKHMVTE